MLNLVNKRVVMRKRNGGRFRFKQNMVQDNEETEWADNQGKF